MAPYPTDGPAEGWRWSPRGAAKGAGAALLIAAVLGSAGVGAKAAKTTTSTATTNSTTTTAPATTTTAPIPTTTAAPIQAAGVASSDTGGAADLATFGERFTTWNTTRNVLRTELNLAMGPAEAQRNGTTGAGIDVALIDTGVAPVSGLDTDGTILNGPDLSLDYQAGLPAAIDGFGHGTHLAGIIAGRDAGVAPGARIVNMKTGAANGAVDVSQVIASIDWVVTHRKDPGMNVRVINLAYGTDSTQLYTSSPLTHAVESAWRNGIVVVVSAGNSGGALVNPATDPFVLTVGAADTNNPYDLSDDTLAPFSSVGTTARGVDVLAPGTSVTSLRVPGSTVDTLYPESRTMNDRYTKGSGTSQAAAWVSGAVSLLLQSRPNLTPDQVKAIIKATARPIPGVASYAQGGGVIDITTALTALVPNSKQFFKASTGTGSIEAARGTAHLVADDGTILQGEVDLQGQAWKGSTWASTSTAGAAWSGGTWNGNVWAGDGFDSNYTVDGVVWTGRTWRASLWSGRTWRADLWAGRTWRADLWAGRTWRGDGWA